MKRPNTFKRYLKMIRPFDWIIVGGLFLAAFIPYLIFGIQENQQQQAAPQRVLTAVVTHDGHEVYRKRLTGHTGTTQFTYRAKDSDWNQIEVQGAGVAITEANCQDQVCVRRGRITKPGQTIVCLPHKLLIEIKSNKGGSNNTGGMVTE
ncbi:NusG domain II-containing protein [Lacticaseibacillus chiayiensis]|uniref:NusG domain II-containing protein n=1 Tax=Lacticaseibacillus chiayiensis TaxID=2100821 RepID=UPI003C765856